MGYKQSRIQSAWSWRLLHVLTNPQVQGEVARAESGASYCWLEARLGIKLESGIALDLRGWMFVPQAT